jgi:hypothetical protein
MKLCGTIAPSNQGNIMATKQKAAFITVRVTEQTRSKFHAKALRYSTPSGVLRDLIDAFIQDRVAVSPPVNHVTKESIYVKSI